MKAYKGFDKSLKCRGYQYEIGKAYDEPEANLCKNGFHACERPLDVFSYYPPSNSRYCVVELDEVSSERNSDSKVCAKKIKVGAEVGIAELVEAQIKYVKEHTTTEHTDPKLATAGDYGAATAGSYGAATAGYHGAATAGECGVATAGECGAATAGECGAATAGECGVATAGSYGAATAGYRGAATAGSYGAATAGSYGAATSKGSSSVGLNGIASSRGENAKVRGGLGAVLVCAVEHYDSFKIKTWACGVVDGDTIKADTWYTAKDGQLMEVTDSE